MRPSLLSLFVAVIAAWTTTVAISAAATPPPFPTVPIGYSATVVLTLSQNNLTTAYEEYYDGTRGLLRTNGRYGDEDLAEIFDFNKNTSVSFSAKNGGPSCNRTSIALSSDAAQFMRPSRDFIVQYATQATYAEKSNSAATRYLECESWTASQTQANGTVVVNTTFFAATSAIQGVEYAPVRLEVHVFAVRPEGTVPVFDLLVDWFDFTFQVPSQALHLTAPPVSATCAAEAPASSLPLHPAGIGRGFFSQDKLDPAPVPSSFPTLPRNFRVTLEAKLSHGGDGTLGSLMQPYTHSYEWSMNAALGLDRLDYQILTSDTNDASAGVADIIGKGEAIRIFQANTSAVGAGTVWEYRSAGPNGRPVCTTQPRSLSNVSPLDARRAGSLPALFMGALPSVEASITDSSSWQWVGRSTLRGVEVDQWRSTRVRFNGDALYTFQMDVLLAVKGWRFPGVAIAPGVAIPLRVINIGSWMNNSVETPASFVDVYDFARFLPDVAVPAVFDPIQAFPNAVCPPVPARPADAVFPPMDMSTSYRMRVSAAMLNRGYVLTFQEFYDAPSRRLRTENRFTGAGSIEINDFAANTSTVYSSTGADTSCFTVPLVSSQLSDPSASFFVRFANVISDSTYIGRASDADSRYVLADRWQATQGVSTSPGRFSNFTATFMSSVRQNGIGAEPLKIKLVGFSYMKDLFTGAVIGNSIHPYMHTYDLLDFEYGRPDPSVFNIPASIAQPCTRAAQLPANYRFSRPSARVIVPPTVPPSPARPLAPAFSALLEAKVWSDPNSASGPEVHVLEWSLDRANKREYLRRLMADSSSVRQVILYDSYPSKGRVFTQRASSAECDLTAFDTSVALASTASSSPPRTLWSLFSGALLSALVLDPDVVDSAAPGYLSYQDGSSFQIQADRGVVADRYTATRRPTVASQATALNYSSEFFLSNPGWIYVSASNAGTRPVRVNVKGMSTDSVPSASAAVTSASGAARPFSAVLDVFHYSTGAQAASQFDASTLCSNYATLIAATPVSPATDGGMGSSSTSSAATAIMVIIFIAVVLSVAYFGWRGYTKWHNKAAREAHQSQAQQIAQRQAAQAPGPLDESEIEIN